MTPRYHPTTETWHVAMQREKGGEPFYDTIPARSSHFALRVMADRLGVDLDDPAFKGEFAVWPLGKRQLELVPELGPDAPTLPLFEESPHA